MSNTKHTPGPWTHEGNGDITGIEDNGFGRGPVDVCSVYLRTVKGRTEANARLIAAAPELLAALQMIAGELPCIDNLMSDKDIARAAIAKAQGEQT